MKGVYITKINKVHEDERRGIFEIMNGQMSVKNIKVLKVTEDSYLGGCIGHMHQYAEIMYIMKGKAKNYRMINIDTHEIEYFNLEEGDVVFRTGRIIHGGLFKKGSIVIDGSTETYISSDFNDIALEEINLMCKCGCGEQIDLTKNYKSSRGIPEYKKNHHLKEVNPKKKGTFKKGECHPNWRGDEVGYQGLHSWVRVNKPKPKKCQRCDKRTTKLDASNISGTYKRDLNDFEYLCKSCHNIVDERWRNFKNG